MSNLLLTIELSAELAKYGWPLTADHEISDRYNTKYPLIKLTKLKPDRWETASRVRLSVDTNKYITIDGVPSGHSPAVKEHLIDTKLPQWRRTLQRWFGCAVMELLPAHQKLADELHATERRKAGQRAAMQALHPCSDNVANFLLSRATIRWSRDPASPYEIESFDFVMSYTSFECNKSTIPEVLPHLIRLLEAYQKSTNRLYPNS
jgi:hypothetical protein